MANFPIENPIYQAIKRKDVPTIQALIKNGESIIVPFYICCQRFDEREPRNFDLARDHEFDPLDSRSFDDLIFLAGNFPEGFSRFFEGRDSLIDAWVNSCCDEAVKKDSFFLFCFILQVINDSILIHNELWRLFSGENNCSTRMFSATLDYFWDDYVKGVSGEDRTRMIRTVLSVLESKNQIEKVKIMERKFPSLLDPRALC